MEKVTLIQNLRHFFRIFHIFGQAPYYPLTDRNKLRTKVRMYLPLMLLVVNVVICVGIYVSTRYLRMKTKKTVNVLLYVTRCSGYLSNFVVIYNNISSSDCWIIMDKIHYIIHFMETKLKARFALNKFKQNCFRQFFMCAMAIMSSQIFRCIYLTIHPRTVEMVVLVIHLYEVVTLMHALFYVNFFHFILMSLKENIKNKYGNSINFARVRRASSDKTNREVMMLRQIQFIHFQLYEVIKVFNRQFGLCLIAILFDLAATLAIGAYYVVYFLTDLKRLKYISRKYRCVLKNILVFLLIRTFTCRFL